MKNSIYIICLLLFSSVFVACEDDTEAFNGPYRLSIGGGPAASNVGTTRVYTIGDVMNPSSYTWTVQGPAEIVGETTGNSASVRFTGVGAVTLTVSNGRDARTRTLTSRAVVPALTASLNTLMMYETEYNRTLRNGAKDTIFFTFASPLLEDPTIAMDMDDDAFKSGSLGNLVKEDARNYYAIYTAGAGNGTPSVIVSNIKTTEAYGSGAIAADTVSLYRVDNVAPVANVSYSQSQVADGAVVTVMVEFTEPVRFVDEADSAFLISFSGAGVEAMTDTLEMVEGEPLMYTYEYEVASDGNGEIDVEIGNVMDFAGNPLTVVNYDSDLELDNTKPMVVIGTAEDIGTAARIGVTASEAGTAMYLIRPSTATAPADEEAFMSASGTRGSIAVGAGMFQSVNVPVGTGSYKVYYLTMDEAGNYSAITSTALVMN